jgi:hypothetical protein
MYKSTSAIFTLLLPSSFTLPISLLTYPGHDLFYSYEFFCLRPTWICLSHKSKLSLLFQASYLAKYTHTKFKPFLNIRHILCKQFSTKVDKLWGKICYHSGK